MTNLLLAIIFFTFYSSFESKNLNNGFSSRVNNLEGDTAKVNTNYVFGDVEEREDEPKCQPKAELTPEFRYFSPSKPNMDVVTNLNFHNFKDIVKNSLDTKVQTVFIIHGYLGGNAQWPIDIKDALIEKEKCNVFIVDWTGLDGLWYGTAMDNIRTVGQEVGIFIELLMGIIPLDVKKVHVIGHSLGAHASGFAGKFLKERDYKLGRITGLDPAGPDFNELSACDRLSQFDADFVDVIHSNWAGEFWESVSGFGLEATVGHFDFYPNGGEDQPGCKTAGEAELDIGLDLVGYLLPNVALIKILSGGIETTKEKFNALACSHGRAYEYFYWSIKDKDNGCRFSADECPNWDDYNAGKCKTPADQLPKVQMGYYSIKYVDRVKGRAQRKFYLRTTDSAPYCVK